MMEMLAFVVGAVFGAIGMFLFMKFEDAAL